MAEHAPSPLEAALADINPDLLSPKDALALLYQLKAMLSSDG
jgi:DNA mismatch repair protein MutS